MNFRTIQVASVLATALVITSCESNHVFQQATTESGYPFFHHVDINGANPSDGDYAYCYIDMRNGEKLVNTNRHSGKLAKLKINIEIDDHTNSPIIDGLKLMSIGDSLTVHYPISELKDKPKGFEQAAYIAYDIKLVDIKSSKEYKADFKARWKKATASLN